MWPAPWAAGEKMVNPNAKDKQTLALLEALIDWQKEDKLFENQQLLRNPHRAQRPQGHRGLTSPMCGRTGSNRAVGIFTKKPWAGFCTLRCPVVY